ncbi:MAG: Gfo/Idh/MocA family oxidoreductase [Chloroflexi bacterium]|nr:Gfo/Idh/MocA family oxidoreductase [Chloroflexota bacterium]
MSKTTLRVAIIGAGMIAEAGHIPAWQGTPDSEIVAIASRTAAHAQEAAGRHGIPRAYDDWRRMLEETRPDVVSVCTPNATHREVAIGALEAGCHVLCEKPAATSHADAVAMFAAAEAAGRVLYVGQNGRFAVSHRAAWEIARAGHLGEMYYAETAAMRRRGVPTWGVFHLREYAGGGPVYDIGVHALDTLLWIMGNPRVVAVSSVTFRRIADRDEGLITSLSESGAPLGVHHPRPFDPGEVNVEDLAAAFVRLDGGGAVTFRVSWAANIPEGFGETVILGTEGGLRLQPLTLFGRMGRYQADVTPLVPPDPDVPFHGIHQETAHLARVIREGEEPLVRREEVLNVMAALDAIYRSAAEGHEVQVA